MPQERIVALVASRRGLTEAMIAKELFGAEGYRQRINPLCRKLVDDGRLVRKGSGVVDDPYTYALPRQKRANRSA